MVFFSIPTRYFNSHHKLLLADPNFYPPLGLLLTLFCHLCRPEIQSGSAASCSTRTNVGLASIGLLYNYKQGQT